ncbi:MAG: DUF6252 family protein [Mucilaginibacter sp.]
MKKILIASLVACTLLVFSCAKEYAPHDLFIGATLKNTNWVAQPSTSYFANRDSLQINGIYSTSSQSLAMKIRFNGIGSYTLKDQEASFNIFSPTGGVSAPLTSYKLDINKTNTLTITAFDIKTNIATGSFQVNFVKTNGSGDNTLSLTNGRFWIQLPPVN